MSTALHSWGAPPPPPRPPTHQPPCCAALALHAPAGPPNNHGGHEVKGVLEVAAYSSVSDLIHAAVLVNGGAASLKEVRRVVGIGRVRLMGLMSAD